MNTQATILWVDDDLYSVTGSILGLETAGFQVSKATTLQEAKDSITKLPPSLVIVDLMMPAGSRRSELETKGGFESGVVLIKLIIQK